jgi:hypothetical protein
MGAWEHQQDAAELLLALLLLLLLLQRCCSLGDAVLSEQLGEARVQLRQRASDGRVQDERLLATLLRTPHTAITGF